MAYRASDWLDGVDTVQEGSELPIVDEIDHGWDTSSAAYYRGYKAGRDDTRNNEFAELWHREVARGNWWQGACWLTWLCLAATAWGMLGM